MNYLKLGFRNILRNPRRSLATGLAVAFGFAAINLFFGYISNVYGGLSDQAIHGERLGHLTIMKNGALRNAALEPEKYLLAGNELARLTATLHDDPAVKLVALRLGVNGIVSNGEVSTVFIGEGMKPEDVVALRGDFRRDRGSLLDPAKPMAGAVASDLARMLSVEAGDYMVLLGSTITGQTNALDLDVGAVFNTGNAGTNDKFLLLPLSLTQQLLATDGADRVVLLLNDANQLSAVRDRLENELNAAGFDIEIHSWQELSSFYKQVRNLFDMIFAFIFSIVIVIVLMSIVNTMGMSVVERTREIGTLRAVGMKRRQVVQLFTVEGFLLVVFGGIAGVLITLAVGSVVNTAELSYVPPNNSDPVRLLIDFVPLVMLQSLILLGVVAALAALMPARRAARTTVVEALAHV